MGTNADHQRAWRQRQKAKLAHLAQMQLPALVAAGIEAKSWRVELTTEDGTRLVNSARFETKAEAALYVLFGIDAFMKTVPTPLAVIVATRVLPSDDEPSGVSLRWLRGWRAGQLKKELVLPKGGCGVLRWYEDDTCDAQVTPQRVMQPSLT
jgi:hypothetical protein